jgi:hypothetical protein
MDLPQYDVSKLQVRRATGKAPTMLDVITTGIRRDIAAGDPLGIKRALGITRTPAPRKNFDGTTTPYNEKALVQQARQTYVNSVRTARR